MTDKAPIIVPGKPLNERAFAAFVLLCSGLLILTSIIGFSTTNEHEDRVFLGLLFVMGAGALFWGTSLLRTARMNLDLLRIDQNGISGSSVETATWEEISKIEVFEGKGDLSGQSVLGFLLENPAAFQQNLGFFQKSRISSLTRKRGYHMIVQQKQIKEHTVEFVRDSALKLQAEAQPERRT